MKSSLKISDNVSDFLSLYILLSIGLRGGFELSAHSCNSYGLFLLAIALLTSIVTTLIAYVFFMCVESSPTAIALSASYGSISAVTFVTAMTVLDQLNITYSPWIVSSVAIMEVPAIIIAICLYVSSHQGISLYPSIAHALKDKSIVLLLGGIVIGFLLTQQEWGKIESFYTGAIFFGMLSLFLLEIGMKVATAIKKNALTKPSTVLVAITVQLLCGLLAIVLAYSFNLAKGDAFLLTMLAGSASYIAAPAAMKYAIPDASESVYFALPLGVTFPINILVGIPCYLQIITLLW